ncbi:hypothetical protein SBRCBS47491_007795 [Sporothrix bragantina]|uniref:CFEM domain-containing protein n=1 Tax=Sporothrix bragantina TaxID=671064 RepID=A0ABP0CGJ8_9PEZI
MKAVFGLIVAAAASANALTQCILDCQSSVAAAAGCDAANYNATTCYCDNENYPTAVKACLYSNNCDTDVDDYYDYRTEICSTDSSSSGSGVTINTNETIADNGGVLGDCILACQAESAVSAGCSGTNYNETSCYCDNDNFATDVKACLYQNCSSEVPVFYNYRADICDTDTSAEYFSTLTAADATAGIATTTAPIATGAAATTTAAGSSSSSSSSTSGAIRDVVCVTGLAAFVAAAMLIVS